MVIRPYVFFSPPSFALTSSKEEQVVDIWGSTIEGGGWNPMFSRPFNDWKVEEVVRFLLTIQGKRIATNVEDTVLWKETKDGIFFC